MSGAWIEGLRNGFRAPGWTGISGLPIATSKLRALLVTLSSDALPWTVEMPSSLKAGSALARIIARASSWPAWWDCQQS